jgi:hypothetical protein
LGAALRHLSTPIEVTVDPMAVATELEATRLALRKEGERVREAQHCLNLTLDEYNIVIRNAPSCRGDICIHG